MLDIKTIVTSIFTDAVNALTKVINDKHCRPRYYYGVRTYNGDTRYWSGECKVPKDKTLAWCYIINIDESQIDRYIKDKTPETRFDSIADIDTLSLSHSLSYLYRNWCFQVRTESFCVSQYDYYDNDMQSSTVNRVIIKCITTQFDLNLMQQKYKYDSTGSFNADDPSTWTQYGYGTYDVDCIDYDDYCSNFLDDSEDDELNAEF